MPSFLHFFLEIIFYTMTVYFYLLIIAIILSWTTLIHTKFYKMLERITDPFLNVFRGFIIIGQFDLTPTLGIMLFYFVLQLFQLLL